MIQNLRTVMFKNFRTDDHILNEGSIQLNNCIYCGSITVNRIERTNIRTDKTESINICPECLKIELENIKKYQREDL
jgi:hypothetical protein